MLIRGSALVGTVTIEFTVSGQRGDWKVAMTAPGGVVTEDETTERQWHLLFTEMLSTAVEGTNRRRGIPVQREAIR